MKKTHKKSVKICVICGFFLFLVAIFAKGVFADQNSWQVKFLIQANGISDCGPDTPTFGVKEGALDGYDTFDVPGPGCWPNGDCLNLYFPHSDEPFFKQFKRDIRPPIPDGGTKRWDLYVQVANFSPANVTIFWPDLSLVPAEYKLTLIDATGGGQQYDMRAISSFSYSPGMGGWRQFQVVVSNMPPVVANAGNDVSLCPGTCAILDGSASDGTPPYTYSWSPTAGLSNPNTAAPTACPTTTTTYTLSVTDDSSYTDSDQVVVTVNSSPRADAGSDTSIRSGDCTTLNGQATDGTPPYTYSWSPTAGLSNPNTAAPTACPTTTTTYTLTVTDNNDCVDTDQVIVTVNGDILINEVAFKETNDWIEFYVIAGGDLSGIRLYEGTTQVKGFLNITAVAGDYVILHFNSSTPDEDDATGKGANGYWDIYTVDSGLTGTDNVVRIQKPGTTDVSPVNTLDAVIWSDNNGSFTGSKTVANDLVGAGHWAGYDFDAGDSGAWIDSDDISAGESIGRDCNSTDNNSRDDWAEFTSQTMGENNVFAVNAGADDIVCSGTCTTLNGSVSGGVPPYSYSWTPTTGLDDPNVAAPTACPTTTTTYTLTVTDKYGCSDQDQAVVTVNPSPTADAGSDTSIYSGDCTTLNGSATGGSPPYTYSWISSPTGFTSSDSITTACPTTTTTYTLTVTDDNGCTDTDQALITVYEEPIEANFDSDITTGCAPLTVNFTDLSTGSPTSWWWDLDGDGIPDVNLQNSTYTYTNPGTYTISLTVFDGSYDVETKTDYITINSCPSAPTADFSATPTSGCAPLTVSFTDLSTGSPSSWWWDLDGDGIPDVNLQNPTYTYTNPGTYTISLTVFDGSYDVETKTDYIRVNLPLTVNAGVNVTVCSGTCTTLNGSASGGNGGYTYSWSPTTGLDDPNVAAPTACPTTTTTYTLTVTDSNGCTDTDQTTITVNPAPVAAASSNSSVCEDGLIQLTGGPDGMSSYNWAGPGGWISTLKSPTRANATSAMTGTYTLTVTNSNGCTDEAQTIVTVNTSSVEADFAATPTAPLKVDFTDSSAGSITSYLWEFGDGKTSSEQNPSHTYKTPGKYTVFLTISDTCTSNTKADSVTVVIAPRAIIIDPEDRDRIFGDILLIRARDLNEGEIARVIFQYRPSKGGDWTDIGPAFPPALETIFDIPGEGDYRLRATAYDDFGFKDPYPQPITVTFTQTDCQYVEKVVRKDQDNTILLCDGSSVTILKDSLEKDTDIIKVEKTDSLSCFLGPGEDLVPVNAYLEISLLLSEQERFDKEVTIKMKYQDEDSNGLIGDLQVLEETLNIYYCGGSGWERLETIERDPVGNTITARNIKETSLPAKFGLFGEAASDLSNLIIYPNPCRIDKGNNQIIFANLPAGYTIRIYNIAGELVKFDKEMPAGSFSWDLKNGDGQMVSPGVYIYVIERGGRVKRGKIAVIR